MSDLAAGKSDQIFRVSEDSTIAHEIYRFFSTSFPREHRAKLISHTLRHSTLPILLLDARTLQLSNLWPLPASS